MPSKDKATYGPTVKRRAKRLLDALLAYVNLELDGVEEKITNLHITKVEEKKPDKTSKQLKLVIDTTLQALEYLTGKANPDEGKLGKEHIRQLIKVYFKEFLGIIEYERANQTGEDWHFTLTLWSQNREENLEHFESEWENRRPAKSKEQEETVIKTVVNPVRKGQETLEDKIYQALLKLDYSKQAYGFQYFVERYQILACLIHGSLEYGPRWLMNRLIQQVPDGGSSNNYVRKISFSRNTQNRSLKSICKEISRKLGIKSTDIREIAEKICQLWQSQTVILIFDNTPNLEEDDLESFLENFWQPLAKLASQTGTTNDNYRLLLFLLDLEGYTNDWKIPCTQEMTPASPPGTLIKLQEIEPLHDRELSYWLEKSLADDKLPPQSNIVAELLQQTEGSHQKMLEEICSRYNITWEEQEAKWLKY